MIGVVGAGAFGTALAIVLARDGDAPVVLLGRNAAAMAEMQSTRRARRLPSQVLPDRIRCTANIGDLHGARAVLLVVPAQKTEEFLSEHGTALPDAPVVLCAKGIGAASLRFQSEIAAGIVPERRLAALTGPGFANEIARGLPTALTLACEDADAGRDLQEMLARPRLRLYLTGDLVGAQLGGAFKNVIAIACGMAEGASLGSSARAALMTRGFAEMCRLGVAIGARPETLSGLSGLGDLSLTCNSPQSRNFMRGLQIGRGDPFDENTVEGVATARAACNLAARHAVELPIAEAVAGVLEGGISLDDAMEALLSRPLKEE